MATIGVQGFKLMTRFIPIEALNIDLAKWFRCYFSCVIWYDSFLARYYLRPRISFGFGVRQGSVVSPYLFTIFIDDVAKLCRMNSLQVCCLLFCTCMTYLTQAVELEVNCRAMTLFCAKTTVCSECSHE